ncbi:MAG: hypothetical protein A2381_11100 [Bdellovibrionales bacterium RIFOXYB1_FULL_37_110]|nr:MAG: hypothetical protein A2181_01420 [Bdellovibrionales bacterium RIFOXYA1_FULL_38_20]OFZ48587.1 MAG: hypothetical protein A2417_09585 [Bdellovibrionales bacterium RIFOXYC1_FULL_37_79]OFZ58396.1 MAG: hypothetical protein A2381_11100 [Bdellovibrionales bacterium RIFOXYB1_FULL_37_110]OFZ62515.1 MAG: hypothetical protein A2577_01230 [Bdellovibrionales bacterium RIFOXYD1_FULL_36_51]
MKICFLITVFCMLLLTTLASGLKTEDLKNTVIDTSTKSSENINPEEQKKIQEALTNYQKKIEENNKVLEEIDKNDK